MYKLFRQLFSPKQYYWCTKDQDFPVELVRIAGEFDGVKFAEVLYQGKPSYVPYSEIVWK